MTQMTDHISKTGCVIALALAWPSALPAQDTPLPLLAEGQSAAALDSLITACNSAMGKTDTPLERTTNVQTGVTADGNIIIFASQPQLNGAAGATQQVVVGNHPGGTLLTCMLTLIQPEDGAFDDLAVVAAERAGALLGDDMVQVGGPISGAMIGMGESYVWSGPEFPPMHQLSLNISPMVVMVAISQLLPAE